MKPGVSVIICAQNAEGPVGALLENLSRQAKGLSEGAAIEVIVADSASSDGTAQKAEEAGKGCAFPVKVIRIETPGKSKALNAALKAATGGILAFLDDDVWPCDNWLKNLIRAFSESDADILGGGISAEWTDCSAPSWFTPAVAAFSPVHDLSGGIRAYDPPFSSPVGANFAVRRAVFDKIGPFDEKLGHIGKTPYGAEESELAFRAARSGFHAVYDPDVAVVHPFSRSCWNPASMLRRAFYQGMGMARFLNLHGLAIKGNPWLSARFKKGTAENSPPAGRNALYFALKTQLYAGYLYGCVFR